jgi:hypothetical protein
MKNTTKRRVARSVRFGVANDKNEGSLSLLGNDVLPILKKPRASRPSHSWWRVNTSLPRAPGSTWVRLVSMNPRLIRNWTRRFVP